MKKLIFLIIFLFSTNASTEELSKEMQNGKLKVQTVCVTCHGINGQATGAGNSVIIPNITAQEKNYMVARLKAYKEMSCGITDCSSQLVQRSACFSE